ncbi:MAG: hypothetical protein WAO91_08700 [Candidatus Nitrosotenuis sp.]
MKTFEVKASSHGKGMLYVTSLGIAFESLRYGLVLDLSFEWLRSYVATKNDRFEIIWDTWQGERFRYAFKLESGRRAASTYAIANSQYAGSVSETESLARRRNFERKDVSPDLL